MFTYYVPITDTTAPLNRNYVCYVDVYVFYCIRLSSYTCMRLDVSRYSQSCSSI